MSELTRAIKLGWDDGTQSPPGNRMEGDSMSTPDETFRHYKVETPTFEVSEDLIARRLEDYLEARRATGWHVLSLSHVDGATFVVTFVRKM